jgi:hypothetical protein
MAVLPEAVDQFAQASAQQSAGARSAKIAQQAAQAAGMLAESTGLLA